MNATSFLKDQLLKTLQDHSKYQSSTDAPLFVILPESPDGAKSIDNISDIINWWVLPGKTEIRLKIEQVVVALVSIHGVMPLWVRVKELENNIILLNISRRFRKLKDIRNHYNSSEYMPFIYDNALNLEFTDDLERWGLTKKLLWRFSLEKAERLVFEKNPLRFDEVSFFFEKHFCQYIFYPGDYNHRKPGDKGYSKLVIKRKGKSEYQILENIGTASEENKFESGDLTAVLKYYLEKEKNYLIDQLKVQGI